MLTALRRSSTCLIVTLACANAYAQRPGAKPGPVAKQSPVFGFERSAPGPYGIEEIRADWPGYGGSGDFGRGTIVQDGPSQGKALRVAYPKDAVGPKTGGMQFVVPLPPADEYWLTYHVKFEEGFDFRKGGKLPGLTSGGSKFTGGRGATSGDGWSARYMWKDGGKLQVYLYHTDMKGEYGDGIYVPDARFTPGRWHELTQHIKLNNGDATDGVLEVWFDGRPALQRTDIRYRLGGRGPIDSFYFSTFHGGNSADWAPQNDSFARFDDFSLERTRPAFVK
ncbi:MAG: hypothetical protein JNK76_15685 [Planctomycetales bacterium]|nr:hypothetical protein [Planctomycetales bacterium]MBN8627723.1 hypothetical protein [Planctomycetota bacterium]